MNLWYKKSSIFVIAGVVYLVGQYFRGVWFLGSMIPNVCGDARFGGVVFCNSPYLDTLGWPLIDLGQMLAVVALILLFANAATFRKWLKFSLFYIPIVVVLDLLIYPIRFFSLSPELTYSQGVYPFGDLFIIITLGIVLWNLFTDRRKGSVKA
ncbi:MAG: hypothetical protein ACYC48_02735 [Minisyncoccota bacterium]